MAKQKKPEVKVKLPRLTRDFVTNVFDITDPYWSHVTAAQARKIASKMLQYAKTNVKAIEKADLYSPALEVYRNSGGKLSDIGENASRPRTILELARLQQFLASRSSTARGIREIQAEQDARIFGVNPTTGRPLRRMTKQQRRDYWAAYNEFMNGDSYARYRHYNSNVVQQALFSVGLNKKKFSAEDFQRVINRLPAMQRMYEENPYTFKQAIRDINWKEYDENRNRRTAEDIIDENAAVRTGRRNRR